MLVTAAAFAKPAVPVESIPQAAKDFIAKNFASNKASYAEADRNEWEVVLDNGTEIEFTATGEWKKVESRVSVPANIMPEAVAKQVAEICPNEAILEVEKTRGTYEVKIANLTRLRISENGTLLEQKSRDTPKMHRPAPSKNMQHKKPDAASGASKKAR